MVEYRKIYRIMRNIPENVRWQWVTQHKILNNREKMIKILHVYI